jgi:hypothetical protein
VKNTFSVLLDEDDENDEGDGGDDDDGFDSPYEEVVSSQVVEVDTDPTVQVILRFDSLLSSYVWDCDLCTYRNEYSPNRHLEGELVCHTC